MSDFPFFSIIIPTYNRAALLQKAISSVIQQTFTNWELIIVDDGSTDNTKECVISFTDNRIKYIYQSNQERSVARNNGISHSNGEYICFLDSDDYYLLNRLELLNKEITALSNPIALFYTGISFDKNGHITTKTELVKEEQMLLNDFIVKAIIGVPQTCVSKIILLKHLFNPAFHIGEDLELWLRIVDQYPLYFLPNQYTVIATDHEDRSVNEKKNNTGSSQLKVLEFIFKKEHPGYSTSKQTKKEIISETYFKIARHYMFNNKKMAAINWIFKALLKKQDHIQQKHWVFCIYSLFLGKIPNEYKS